MLVLTRKQQEKIQIGDNITITILRTKGKSVRLGIEAPGSVSVLRGELTHKEQSAEVLAAEHLHEPESKPSAPSTPTRAQRTADWPTEKATSDTAVSLGRVPKSRVATVLPELLGDKMLGKAGPLRAMLDRRATAPQA